MEDLLDLGQAERGRLNLDLGPVDVVGVVARVLEACPPPEDRAVAVAVPADLGLLADGAQLQRAVTNLVANAYRYGGSHISIEADAASDEVVIVVADDRAGVGDDMLGRLFEPFSRGAGARARWGRVSVCRS